jgi:acyl dehydratase
MIEVKGLDELKAAVGQEAVSDWHDVTQEDINRFAEVTGDDNWIHLDVERAKQTPFGGTIAHGYYTLSLGPMFTYRLFKADGFAFGVNYGSTRCASRRRCRSASACACGCGSPASTTSPAAPRS